MGGGGGGGEKRRTRGRTKERERERGREITWITWSDPFVVIRTSMWHLYEFSLSTRQLPFQRVCGPNKKESCLDVIEATRHWLLLYHTAILKSAQLCSSLRGPVHTSTLTWDAGYSSVINRGAACGEQTITTIFNQS